MTTGTVVSPTLSIAPVLRGFAAMMRRGEAERVRELGSKGGKRAQESQRAHRWSSAEASEAARRSWARRRAQLALSA